MSVTFYLGGLDLIGKGMCALLSLGTKHIIVLRLILILSAFS